MQTHQKLTQHSIVLLSVDSILELAAFPKIGDPPFSRPNFAGMLLIIAGSELHQLRHVSWLSVVYTVSVATMQPLVSDRILPFLQSHKKLHYFMNGVSLMLRLQYSRLSDIYGRKALLLASYCFFATGILLW